MLIHVTMSYDTDMEIIHAFNPMYALPIVAVVLCALIVYAFGFKSPIQPPSFDGLEDDKKSSKKRKMKELQKQSKLVTNGKSSGIAMIKGKVQEISKKFVTESSISNGKSKEKKPTDKKAAKTSKSQNENFRPEKKESVITDDVNDEGWVQHISKKGKKNRNKNDNTKSDSQTSNSSLFIKTIETTVDEISDSVEIPPKQMEKVTVDAKIQDYYQKPLKKLVKKETTSVPEKSFKQDASVEVNPDIKQPVNDQKLDIPTVAAESKKKKSEATNLEKTSVTTVYLSESSSDVIASNSSVLKILEPVVDNMAVNRPVDAKTNVLFDELAGLYPEAKEKKKKKIRRDH